MVSGRVVASGATLKPVVELHVYGPSENGARVQAVVDTGFTEQLTLPAYAVAALNLPFVFDEKLTMANDESTTFDVFIASINWDGQLRAVKVHLAEGDPLIGMDILREPELHIHAIPDGRVNIEPVT